MPAALVLLSMAGCRTGTLPNPNDPRSAGTLAPEVLRRDMRVVSEMLNDRMEKGEIDDKQYQMLIEDAANRYLEGVHIENIKPEQAWEYVEVLRAAHRWKDAEAFGRIAVKWAIDNKNEDRRVNDTLRLAQAIAGEGRIPEAIKLAREAMTAGDKDTAPILMATLYEITPLSEKKGHDVELAKLLEDAIACHNRTVVDHSSRAGKLFLLAKPRHIRLAWEKIIQLYRNANQPQEAAAASERAQRMREQMRSKVPQTNRMI